MQQGTGLDVLGRVCVRLSLGWWCLSNIALQLDIAHLRSQPMSPCSPGPTQPSGPAAEIVGDPEFSP